MVQSLWKTVQRFLKKLDTELLHDLAIPLLCIHPPKTKTPIRKDICTPMFTGALFTIAKIQKQPKRPSTDEWIMKMWYIYIMEYYSATEKNKILPPAATLMDLKGIILRKICQRQVLYDMTYM